MRRKGRHRRPAGAKRTPPSGPTTDAERTMVKPETRWWGYTAKHVRVVLDRTWPGNGPGRGGTLLLVNAEEWSVFEIPFVDWEPPAFTFWMMAFGQMSPEERIRELKILEALDGEFLRRRASLEPLVLKARHGQDSETEEPSPTGREHFVERWQAQCYRCKRQLDSAVHFRCPRCHWIKCWHCASCGCGFWAST